MHKGGFSMWRCDGVVELATITGRQVPGEPSNCNANGDNVIADIN